jgi:hypothetical protein
LYGFKKKYFFILFIVCVVTVNAQGTDKQDIFIAPLVEVINYSQDGISFGAGIALGAGNGAALGLRFLYAVDAESIHTLEMAVLLRFYLLHWPDGITGPFVQLNAGAALFSKDKAALPPALAGAISIGLAAGWRFEVARRIYLEPYIRLGYPYRAGAGLSIAFKF